MLPKVRVNLIQIENIRVIMKQRSKQIMLPIMFAPFMNMKHFDDAELFLKELRVEESEQKTSEFLSSIDFGFSSEDDDDIEAARLKAEFMAEFDDELIGFSDFKDMHYRN